MSLVDKLFSTGAIRRPDGLLGRVVVGGGVLVAVGVIYANIVAFSATYSLAAVFLSAVFTLLFLVVGGGPSAGRNPSPIDYALSALSLATGAYFLLTANVIVERITLLDPLSPDQWGFGITLLALTLEATRRTTGLGLAMIVLAFMAYNLFGDRLPSPFGHGVISYQHFLDILVFTTDGIFGVPVQVVSTYVFLFVMFGTFLSAVGGATFFYDLAASMTGRQPGGPAKIAVLSSGLYGMMSGSPTSDVATTGSITIPMMKKLGYSRSLAAGVEVAASTGGSLVPPVMGSAVFIMAEFTGIDYRDLVIAAVVPALLYYLGVFAQVHFRSIKLGLTGFDASEIPSFVKTITQGWLYLLPLAAITIALLLGYTPIYVAAVGAASVVVISWLRRETRLGPVRLSRALAETTFRMITVTGACAAAGLVIGGLSMTGLGLKFSNLIFIFAGGNPVVVLIMAAIVTVILGLGMPTPSAYILAAVLVGPSLAELGIGVLEANMFLLFYAVMSALTPPVAVAAYTAAAISEGNPIRIAVTAMKLALVGFLIPFAFVYSDGLLAQGPLWNIATAATAAIVAVALLAAAIEGQTSRKMSVLERLGFTALALAALQPWQPLAIAAGLAGGALIYWHVKPRSIRPT